MRRISFFDTTLRDGEQAPDHSMSPDQKVALFHAIDDLGVDVIEAGFPASSENDFKAVRQLARHPRRATLCAFARAVRGDIDRALEALDGAPNVQIQLLGVGSEIHLEQKRRISAEAAIQEIVGAVEYAKRAGVEDIAVGLEDSSRSGLDYLRRITSAAVETGATTVVFADTVGGALAREVTARVELMRSVMPRPLKLSVHCHDDLGLSLANALAAIEAGADEVQVTLCGIGERAGNTALEELAAVLYYWGEHYGVTTKVRNEEIYRVCSELVSMLGIPLARHKSIIGSQVFATEAGIHQQALLRNPKTYEFVEPAHFGRQRQILLGRHSGRAAIEHKLKAIGIQPSRDILSKMSDAITNSPDPRFYNDSNELIALYQRLQPSNDAEAEH